MWSPPPGSPLCCREGEGMQPPAMRLGEVPPASSGGIQRWNSRQAEDRDLRAGMAWGERGRPLPRPRRRHSHGETAGGG